MRIRTLWMPLFGMLVLLAAPMPAQAQQTFLTPYVGSSFNSTFDDYDFGTKLHYGAAITWLGQGGLGFEVDLGYAPTFFEPGEDDFLDFQSKGSVVTMMGNLVLGGGGKGIRPYASGGIGLMRTHIQDVSELFDYKDNGFGVNVGGGLRGGAGPIGIRGDIRYFRQISDLTPIRDFELGDFSFWRASVGVSFGF
ncbi:MAG: outer membrane beta-barrel protein [Acidobacteria bacterium]|nr:outer membrane beta-barrel protein [Acidobacteriota bacterium]